MLKIKYIFVIIITLLASQLFFVQVSDAKTIHLSCENGVVEISINFNMKKVTYAIVGAAQASFTTDAFITGNTVSFTRKITTVMDEPDPLLKKKFGLVDATMESVSEFEINRTTLEMKHTGYVNATSISGEFSRGAESEGTDKCEIQKTIKNKF
jgi:hypothetical protein